VRLAVGDAADLRALADYRRQLTDERTELANRAHAELHGLFPGYHRDVPRLTAPRYVAVALRLLDGDGRVRAELTRRRLHRIDELTVEIKQLRKQIADLVDADGTSLTGIYGVGSVVAATILGEVADVRRYRSRDAFAARTGPPRSPPRPGAPAGTGSTGPATAA